LVGCPTGRPVRRERKRKTLTSAGTASFPKANAATAAAV